MLIQKVEVNDWNNIILEKRIECDQVRITRGREIYESYWRDRYCYYLNMDNTRYETISRQSATRKLSTALTGNYHPHQRDLLDWRMRLKGGQRIKMDPPGNTEVWESNPESTKVYIKEQLRRVTGEQAQVLQFLNDATNRVLVVQAAAGTGKTHVILLYLLNLMGTLKGTVLATASTDLAVQEIAEKVLYAKERWSIIFTINGKWSTAPTNRWTVVEKL